MTAPFLCEHTLAGAKPASFRLVCSTCRSFWDLESQARDVVYDESYPAQRGHYDPAVGALKVRTLRRWLRQTGVEIAGKRVCEVGFGGGSCLEYLSRHAGSAVGIEANESAIEHARERGYPATFLLVSELPARLEQPVDLWLFQDSFEHIPDPASFLAWVTENSSPTAEILLVAPRADSWSQRWLGRFWPHKLADHQFHWSRAGVVEFMERRGFALQRAFFPLKFASPQMFVAHITHKLGAPPRDRAGSGGGFAVPFNFGEMGLVFRRGNV